MITKYKDYIELCVLYVLFISLNLPYFHISIITLPLALYVVFKNKEYIQIDKELIFLLYLFVSYLIIFSIFSINYNLSIKGSFDVLKTMIVFVSGIVFFKKINYFNKLKIFFLLISLIYIMGNFFFDRGVHFNYYENSNSGAINILLVVCISLFLVEFKNFYNNLIISIIILFSIFLIFYAASRGVILSSFISLFILSLIFTRKQIRIYILSISSILLFIFAFFINRKGFGLSNREDIWLPVINYTIENNFLLGNGINTSKVVINLANSFTNIAHNIFVEIFLSSGLIGLFFILYIIYFLIKYFVNLNYKRNLFYYVGLFNIITLVVLFQVDLKFYAYPYLGLFMLSLSGIYVCKIDCKKRETKYDKN